MIRNDTPDDGNFVSNDVCVGDFYHARFMKGISTRDQSDLTD